MGLDMYLTGEVGFYSFNNPEKAEYLDGFRVKCRELDLGYWRKHPDLHGYIIEEFGQGEDTCQQIYFEAEDLRQIIKAIQQDQLPHTEGFFFGESVNDEAEKSDAIGIFEKAIAWLEAPRLQDQWKGVYYQASW